MWTLRSQSIIGQFANWAHFVQDSVESTSLERHICYLPGGRSVWEKTVPEVLSRRPRAVLKTKGTVFSHTDRPSPVNNMFIFFWTSFFRKRVRNKGQRMKLPACLKKHQIKKTKENNVSMFQRLALFWRVSTQIHEKSQQICLFLSCSKLVLQPIITGLFTQLCHWIGWRAVY